MFPECFFLFQVVFTVSKNLFPISNFLIIVVCIQLKQLCKMCSERMKNPYPEERKITAHIR